MAHAAREELDMAVPASFDSINEYYRGNLKKILNSCSYESMSSIESLEAGAKKAKGKEDDNDDGSTTASDSDLEDCCVSQPKSPDRAVAEVSNNFSMSALSKSAEKSATTIGDSLQNKLPNINSVSINNSSDVHFGNKTFYNGPVTIKQIVINDDFLKKKEEEEASGAVNRGFQGSSTQISISQQNASNRIDDDKEKHVNSVQNANDRGENLTRSRRRLAVVSVMACALLATLSFYFIYLQYGEDEEPPHIVTRDEWEARPPKEALTRLELPVNRVIIAHTVTEECNSVEQCAQSVREIQDLHQHDKRFNFSDIAYNYIIGGDGSIFEGRGWRDQGAHTSGYNRGSIGVAFIGDFSNKIPTDAQMEAGFRLFKEGVRVNALTINYRIYGASQLRSTESPGNAFFERIKTWKHWSRDIV